MNATLTTALFSSVLALSAVGAAHGANTNSTFQVKMKVNGSCSMVMPGTIDFGAVDANVLVEGQRGVLKVTCTPGENPTITLSSAGWKMTGAGIEASGSNQGKEVAYNLDFVSIGSQTVSPSKSVQVNGNGDQQEIGIYATAGQATYSGEYTDTVTVALTF